MLHRAGLAIDCVPARSRGSIAHGLALQIVRMINSSASDSLKTRDGRAHDRNPVY